MIIGILTLQFQLNACHSLKDKRRRLTSVRDKYGRQPNIAVCESNFQDSYRQAEWSYVVTATERKVVEQTIAQIENTVATGIDAVVVGREVEYL